MSTFSGTYALYCFVHNLGIIFANIR